MERPCSVCKRPCDAPDEKGVVVCADCIYKSWQGRINERIRDTEGE